MNRVSGPVVPGSEHTPFRPINPHGQRARVVRPDGSPIEWKNPLAVELYQIRVDDAEHGNIAIGPRAAMDVCDQLLAAVKLAIKSGKIRGWSNPSLVSAGRQRAVARVF